MCWQILALLIAIAALSGQSWAETLQCSPPPRKDGVDFSLPCIPLSPIADADSMIYFERGSSVLTRDAAHILDRQADTLHQYPSVRIQLVGHADPVEAPSSRQMGTLAQNRADAARDYLIHRGGIDANRLVAVGRDYSPVIVRNESERILAAIRHVRSELLR